MPVLTGQSPNTADLGSPHLAAYGVVEEHTHLLDDGDGRGHQARFGFAADRALLANDLASAGAARTRLARAGLSTLSAPFFTAMSVMGFSLPRPGALYVLSDSAVAAGFRFFGSPPMVKLSTSTVPVRCSYAGGRISSRIAWAILRHAQVNRAIEMGAPLALVRHQLGHVRIETTSLYLQGKPSADSSGYILREAFRPFVEHRGSLRNFWTSGK